MDLDPALKTFIAESRELLEDMENALLTVEQAEEKQEMINAIFRAAHTIKGSSGLFGLDQVVGFTHVVESVLDGVRGAKVPVSDALVALLLACCDHIGLLVQSVENGKTQGDDQLERQGQPLLARLREYLDIAPCLEEAPSPRIPPPSTANESTDPEGPRVNSDHWHISVQFGPNVLKNGMDPLSFIGYLGTLGEIVAIHTLTESIPVAQEMDPECCYLGFVIALNSAKDKATIEGAFEFVRDDCDLRIMPPRSRIEQYVALIHQHAEEVPRLGEILVRCGTLTERELEVALNAQSGGPREPIGQILAGQGSVQPEVVEAALDRQRQLRDSGTQETRSIRIDAAKLDRLINLIGELIIAGAGVGAIAHRTQIGDLQESASILSGLVQDVRDSALQLRMVKIGATFSRFQRVVHDVSREIGKSIALVVKGEETELDKTVVEKIGDPLMHLVRNAMDHGIEADDVRVARGKPLPGTVTLEAYHDSGSIVIAVRDDGGGLKREKILEKAISRGLIEPHHNLTESEIYGLIFEPGFSTAEQITNLSGRGVGLDVVKRNITALRGSVEISSKEGVGTTVTVRLPLTLAIIDGFLVEVGKSVYVIPLEMIEECVAFASEPGHDYTDLRGQVLPFLRLRELFAVGGEIGRRENIVVLKHAGRRAGLVVDRLLGEFQTVIKPLGRLFSHLKCVSGSTILGSGDVALILDVPALLGRCLNHETGGETSNFQFKA